ncbi:hypothetical protein C7999DRAFT_44339 [Corynascus novoguineensis]|uniref:Uncharacterized protein n=1 Tax=Corynascus novoguineensis TaxID=1126955 RepID=A0AAN7CNE1_9PEZI|nr:hypothetical protein C7999DRAFT_44339 [Corynascus novoguineensis]
MHPPVALCLLAVAGAANAVLVEGTALIPGFLPGQPRVRGAGLLVRDQNPFCTTESTCAECFGEGSLICDGIGCFNPDEYEQCCAGATVCVAKDNDCCEKFGGPGVTGKAGVPTATEPATPTPSSDPSLSFDCYRGDKGEECCQRAPKPPLHWCSGDFPKFWCYNAENQYCCTNGVVCDEEGCCEDLFDESTTHPWKPAGTSTAAGSASKSTVTEPPTSSTATTTPDSASTATTTSGAGSLTGPRYIALGFAALGLALFY